MFIKKKKISIALNRDVSKLEDYGFIFIYLFFFSCKMKEIKNVRKFCTRRFFFLFRKGNNFRKSEEDIRISSKLCPSFLACISSLIRMNRTFSFPEVLYTHRYLRSLPGHNSLPYRFPILIYRIITQGSD